MDINQVLMDYDNMFGNHSIEDIEDFLSAHVEMAMDEKDYAAALSLMNEQMGLYRDTAQNEKGIRCCTEIEDLLVKAGMEGTVGYAASLMNVANAYRAFGYYAKARDLFDRSEVILRDGLPAGDFAFCTLYNYQGQLYFETGKNREAEQAFRRALAIADLHDNAMAEQAETRCSLASVLLDAAGKDTDAASAGAMYDEALELLTQAIRIFEWDGKRDYRYGEALSRMGDALVMKESYAQAVAFYEQALQEIEKHVGKTDLYLHVQEHLRETLRLKEERKNRELQPETEDAQTANGPDEADAADEAYVDTFSEDAGNAESWIKICRRFYDAYGAKMIHEEFGSYEARIAVGIVGEGSECFGYNDAISQDHGFELGFCLWLTEEDDRSIGGMLQQSYEQLLVDFADEFLTDNGIELPVTSDGRAHMRRRGVFSVNEFYEDLLGVQVRKTADGGYLLPDSWMQISEEKLAAATNGQVFRDDAGIFTGVRESLLEYYPTKVWMMRLAEKLHGFAQTAQRNYARMMARQDYVTAHTCVTKGIQYAMEICYLLNQTYAPYYKWMRRGMRDLQLLGDVAPILDRIAVLPNQAPAWEGRTYRADEINYRDEAVACFEDVAEYILMELKMQGVVKGTETNLDIYAQDLMQRVDRGDFGAVDDAEMEASYREYVKDLIQAASETPKEKTKYDIEEEQGLTREWGTEDAFDREEAIAEIVEAEWRQEDRPDGSGEAADDWNEFSSVRQSRYETWTNELLASYRRDMDGAALAEQPDAKRVQMTEELIRIRTAWERDFEAAYPKAAALLLPVYRNGADSDTYAERLRGELGRYSDRTFGLYGALVTEVAADGGNLVHRVMTNLVRRYGYADAEDAEKRL